MKRNDNTRELIPENDEKLNLLMRDERIDSDVILQPATFYKASELPYNPETESDGQKPIDDWNWKKCAGCDDLYYIPPHSNHCEDCREKSDKYWA